MLNLSTLKFEVNTEALVDAKKAIDDLVDAQKALSGSGTNVGKGADAAEKGIDNLGKGSDRTEKAVKGLQRTLDRQVTKLQILKGEMVGLANGDVKLERTFSSGQASMLASAKVAGATKEQFTQLAGSLQDFNQISSGTKFDNTVSGLERLRKEVQELALARELSAQGINLTAKQTRDLAQEEAVLKQQYDESKLSLTEYNEKIAETRTLYKDQANKRAVLIQQSKDASDQQSREAMAQVNNENQLALLRKSVWKEWSQSIGKVSEESLAMREHYLQQETEASRKAADEDKYLADIRKGHWREYAKSVGVTSEELAALNADYREQEIEGIRVTSAEEKRIRKEQDKQYRDTAKSQQFLAAEMQRVDSVLNELNREHAEGSILSEKHANSVSRFANQLKAAGVSGTAAAAQLEQYRGKMQQIEAIENRRAQNRLANALAPQISDVAVSIAGGMPLHLVIMQQGLQIRDLIGQSGVAAEHLQKTMRDAMKNMVTSIGGTIAALGTMTFGALADAGKAVVDFGVKSLGAKGTIDAMNASLAASAIAGSGMSRAILGISAALGVFTTAIAATGIGALVIALGVAAYEFVKLIGANNNLVRELAVTGNVFGVTANSSLQYVDGLTKVGATTREAISIIGEMSKAGNLSRTQIELVGKAAVDMERAAGVAIEDTVKRFSDLAKDPIKALSTLQIQTGAVQPEIMKLVGELVKQGDAAKASGIAVEELARIMGGQTSKMLEDLHPLTQAWQGFKNLLSEVWTGLGNLINRAMGNIPATQKLMEGMVDRQQLIDSLSAGTASDGAFKKRIANLKAQQETDRESLRLLNQRNSAEIQLAQTRSLSERERIKAEEEAKKNRTGGGRGSKGGRSSAEKEVDFFKEIDKVYSSMISKVNELTPLEVKLNEIRTDPRFLAMLPKQQEALAAYVAKKSQEFDATTKAKEAQEAANKAYDENLKFYTDSAKSAEDRLLAMQEEAKATELAETLQISLAQAIEMTAIARLREQQAKEMGKGTGMDDATVLEIQREIEARQKIIAELGKKDSKEVAKDYSDNLQKEFEAMRDGIADSITTALFEGGKAGSQKIRQVIVDALKKPVNLAVTAIVNTLMGAVFGGGGQGGGLSSLLSGGSGGLGGLVDGLSNLYNVGKSFLNGSKIMSEAVGGWTRAADWAATSSNSSVAGVGNWMQSNPMVGNMLGMAGNAFAGYGIGKALSGTISNGYSVGKGYNQFQEIGMAVASAFGGPVFGAIIGAATGAINRLFGRKLKDAGIEGTFSGADQFSGNSYEFYKGGLFRSDKTKRNPLDQATTDALGEAFKAVRDGVLDMSGALGLGAEALDGYTRSIKISTKGMNEQQIQEAWAKEFTAISEEMAQRFMGTFETTISRGNWFTSIRGLPGRITTEWKPGEFVREGETALQALTRLSTAIKVVNPMLEVLKLSMYDVSLAGGDMASKLVDLFGNAETMLGLTTAYYQNYYSEAERTAEATKQMTNALAELGINTLPMSRDAYRDLVESQDLTTEAGRKMFAELMKLAPAFSELTTAMAEVTNGVIDEVRRLRGEIYGSSAATLEAQFAIATAAARAGDSNAMAQLPALSQALEATARLNAVTAADLAISRARLAASLTETLATQGTAIPAFAGGGMYRGGLALVGERGPELINFNRGGRVHNNNETVQMLNNSSNGTATVIAAAMRQVAAVKEVNTEINMMRAETKSTAINMSKLIRLLERVTRDGESLQVTNV